MCGKIISSKRNASKKLRVLTACVQTKLKINLVGLDQVFLKTWGGKQHTVGMYINYFCLIDKYCVGIIRIAVAAAILQRSTIYVYIFLV